MKQFVYVIIPLFLLVLTNSCKKNQVVSCSDSWEADPQGFWFAGDMHVHATGASNDTGGDSDLLSIKQKAMERGLDFVVLTDHSNSTGSDVDTTYEDPALFNQGPEFPFWDSTIALSESNNFLFISGNEVSPVNPDQTISTGHIGCIPMSLNAFNKDYVFIDRPMGSVSGGEALQQSKDAGCFTVVNHPYTVAKWIAYDWSSFAYDALEVWNGTLGFDDNDQESYNAWICDLLAGREVTPIGSSDNHRVNQDAPGFILDPALGYPSTAVFATNLTWGHIMLGLQDGNVAIYEGASRLYIDDYTEGKCRASGSNVEWLRLRGAVDPNLQNAKLTLYHYTSCDDPRPSTSPSPTVKNTIAFEKDMQGIASFDEGISVDGEAGVYAAILSGDGTHYWALSKAIVIR